MLMIFNGLERCDQDNNDVYVQVTFTSSESWGGERRRSNALHVKRIMRVVPHFT